MNGTTNKPILDPCIGGGWIKMNTAVTILSTIPKGNGIEGYLYQIELANGEIRYFPSEDVDIVST